MIRNRLGLAAIQFFHRTLAQYRQSPIARDRQEPGRDPTASLESVGMTPDLEEHFAHQVLGGFPVSDQAQRKAVDAEPMVGENTCIACLSPCAIDCSSSVSDCCGFDGRAKSQATALDRSICIFRLPCKLAVLNGGTS